MPSTTPYNFGDVVLVAFPFTNLQATKQRPAIIVSNTTYSQQRADVIVMAITSQVRTPLNFGEYALQDWQAAGLLKTSVIKPLIATLEQTSIIKTLGQLTATDLDGLRSVLSKILGR